MATATTITGRRRPQGVTSRSDHAPTNGGTVTASTAPSASTAPVPAMAGLPGSSSPTRAGTRIPSSGPTWKNWPNQYADRARWRPKPKRSARVAATATSLKRPPLACSGRRRLHLAALPRPDRMLLAVEPLVLLHGSPDEAPGAPVHVGDLHRAHARPA